MLDPSDNDAQDAAGARMVLKVDPDYQTAIGLYRAPRSTPSRHRRWRNTP